MTIEGGCKTVVNCRLIGQIEKEQTNLGASLTVCLLSLFFITIFRCCTSQFSNWADSIGKLLESFPVKKAHKHTEHCWLVNWKWSRANFAPAAQTNFAGSLLDAAAASSLHLHNQN